MKREDIERLREQVNCGAVLDARNKLADKAEWLREEVDKATLEIREREEEIIDRLSIAASFKDAETGLHTKRVGEYSQLIAKAMGLGYETGCIDVERRCPATSKATQPRF